jgi:predicted AlkP superfamily phosphohydrolase/phosphomutase
MAKKALVIGIDGVPYELLSDLIENGSMPELRKIIEGRYDLHRMKASLPDISSVSWTSFMTGVNPAEHGIFGFTQLMPASYNLYFPNSRHIKAPTFWQTLRKEGKMENTVILNIPNTYPAFPIQGLLVSGFIAVDFNKAVYPPSRIPRLKKMNYIIDVDLMKAREDKEGFYKDLMDSLTIREETSLTLLREEPWDIFVLCATETDRLHHFFMDQKGGALFSAFYERLDHLISTIYMAAREKAGDELLFLMLSDHGFVPLKKEVNLNAYLQDTGLLRLDESKEYYERIAPGTSAFAMDPGRIYLHSKDRFPHGHIKKEEERALRERLKELFSKLTDDDGSKPIQQIYEKEEIYRGPFIGDAPDLVLIARDGYDLKGNLRKRNVFGHDVFTGMHSWHNAVLLTPAGLEVPDNVNIEYPSKIIIDYFS